MMSLGPSSLILTHLVWVRPKAEGPGKGWMPHTFLAIGAKTAERK